MSHKERQELYFDRMAGRHGAVIVRCPTCGRLSRVPRTSQKRWKCPCTPEQSRFIREDILKDQKNIVLESAGTDSDGSGFPRLAYCNMLECVTIKGYDIIPASAFRSCTRLQSVQLGDEVTYIGSDAFFGCCALEEIDLPDSLTAIGESAFHSSGLRRISLPDSLQYIGDGAFAGCSNLTDMEMPKKPLRDLVSPLRVFERIPFEQNEEPCEQANRRNEALIVSLGGGAGNATSRFAETTRSGQDLLLLDSDLTFLNYRFSDRIQSVLSTPETPFGKPRVHAFLLGKNLLRGRGARADPSLGAQALQEAEVEIRALLKHYRFVIVIACLGGGTGSSVPVLAGWLREMGIRHTVIASLPFDFEGKHKYAAAQKARNAIQGSPVTVVSYEQLKEKYAEKGIKITLLNAFETADKEIGRHIQRILAERGPAMVE